MPAGVPIQQRRVAAPHQLQCKRSGLTTDREHRDFGHQVWQKIDFVIALQADPFFYGPSFFATQEHEIIAPSGNECWANRTTRAERASVLGRAAADQHAKAARVQWPKFGNATIARRPTRSISLQHAARGCERLLQRLAEDHVIEAPGRDNRASASSISPWYTETPRAMACCTLAPTISTPRASTPLFFASHSQQFAFAAAQVEHTGARARRFRR